MKWEQTQIVQGKYDKNVIDATLTKMLSPKFLIKNFDRPSSDLTPLNWTRSLPSG